MSSRVSGFRFSKHSPSSTSGRDNDAHVVCKYFHCHRPVSLTSRENRTTKGARDPAGRSLQSRIARKGSRRGRFIPSQSTFWKYTLSRRVIRHNFTRERLVPRAIFARDRAVKPESLKRGSNFAKAKAHGKRRKKIARAFG